MKAKNKLRREAKQKTGRGWKNWRKWIRRIREKTLEAEQLRALSIWGTAQPVGPHYDALLNAEARVRTLEDALRSIGANTCCEGCQEAARAARAALRGGERESNVVTEGSTTYVRSLHPRGGR